MQIAEFKFELLSEITVVPQQYTLHCITTGSNGAYRITMYYSNNQQIYNENCQNGDCNRYLLHSFNNTYDNNVTITWDTETISSGSFNQLTNGDHLYRCNVTEAGAYIHRERFLTVKGTSN